VPLLGEWLVSLAICHKSDIATTYHFLKVLSHALSLASPRIFPSALVSSQAHLRMPLHMS